MVNGEPEVFGGARCAWVASLLGKQTSHVWIFSVCSDERIPVELEQRLCHIHVTELPSHLIILGDFPSIPPEHSPASLETIRLIAEASHFQGVLQVCWIDGEIVNFSLTSPPPLTWYEFPCDKQRRIVHAWPIVQPTFALERDVCADIIQLLGRQPGIRLSDDGTVESLNLTDGEVYRRSLAVGLSQNKENQLWSLVKRLSNLRELRVGFSGLHGIPDLSGLSYLEILDLRGNPKFKLDQISKIRSLKKLNVAACELDAIPLGIENLPLLKTLLLHKNRIKDISTVKFPPLLERLSLYRNQIRTGNLDLSKCSEINEINLGANPLEFMVLSISDEVMSLSLRLRYVRDRVSLMWRGNLGTNPALIHDF